MTNKSHHCVKSNGRSNSRRKFSQLCVLGKSEATKFSIVKSNGSYKRHKERTDATYENGENYCDWRGQNRCL